MKMFRLALAALVLPVFAGQAEAQYVVKRVKCAEAKYHQDTGTLPTFHVNALAYTRPISVQITRNGCRPKDHLSSFRLYVTNGPSLGGIVAYMTQTLYSRLPAGAIASVPSNQGVFVSFHPYPSDARVTGTFDYMYSWE